MKRTISLLLCLMMVLSLATPVFADEPTYTLTIDSTVPDHTFEAWQIFSGDLEDVIVAGGDSYQVLTNIEWGSAIKGEDYDNSAALLAAIDAAADLEDTPASIKALKGKTSAAALADAIADNFQTNLTHNPDLEQLSRIIEEHFEDGKAASSDNYTDEKYEMTGLPAGYYLIKDQDNSLKDQENASYTKFMLRVLKNETVTPKAAYPEVDKLINDTLGGTYTDHEDFDINDYAYYKWEGTLPSNLLSYDTYYYAFHDTLKHKGLTFVRIEQIYLEGHDGNVVHMFYDVSEAEKTITDAGEYTLVGGDTLGDDDNIKLKVGEKDTNGHTKIDLTINDMFQLYGKDKILPTQKFIVKYTVRINRDAVTEAPMDNAVKLEFSNDPNYDDEGVPPTGETPEDVAHAFTFGLAVNKTDGDTHKALEGAEFVLYYQRTENDQIVNYYAQVVTEEMVYKADEDGKLTNEMKSEEERMINGIAVEPKDIGVVYGWTTKKTEASILDTDADGKLNIRGLDEDIYFLEETKAPAGYNLLEAPIQFEIDPAYNPDGTLNKVTYKLGTQVVASKEIPVDNFAGSTLPSTGGMGTTLFYVFGSIMFIGAAVLLITKKRMDA